MVDLKGVLIERLERRGIESRLIPGFIRSLANSLSYDPPPNLVETNERLTYMGWEEFELDYHTFELARIYIENEGLEGISYIPSKWLETTFMPLEKGPVFRTAS